MELINKAALKEKLITLKQNKPQILSKAKAYLKDMKLDEEDLIEERLFSFRRMRSLSPERKMEADLKAKFAAKYQSMSPETKAKIAAFKEKRAARKAVKNAAAPESKTESTVESGSESAVEELAVTKKATSTT